MTEKEAEPPEEFPGWGWVFGWPSRGCYVVILVAGLVAVLLAVIANDPRVFG